MKGQIWKTLCFEAVKEEVAQNTGSSKASQTPLTAARFSLCAQCRSIVPAAEYYTYYTWSTSSITINFLVNQVQVILDTGYISYLAAFLKIRVAFCSQNATPSIIYTEYSWYWVLSTEQYECLSRKIEWLVFGGENCLTRAQSAASSTNSVARCSSCCSRCNRGSSRR